MDQTIDLNSKNISKHSAADRLVDAAGKLFADRPFDAVSTRELAKSARVNLSAISYHFGSKEGLYEACFEELVAELAPIRTGLAAYLGMAVSRAENDPHKQGEMVATLTGMFIDTITSNEMPRWRMRLMIRELQQSGRCFDKIMTGHIDIVHDLIGRMVGSITKRPENSAEVKIMTHSIIGMFLQYGLSEAVLSRRMGWDGYGPEEITFIKEKTAQTILAILGIAPATSKSESEYK